MRHLITGILMILMLSATAQKVLVAEKIGRGRYFSFKEGDMIRLKTINEQFYIYEEIVQVDDSSLLVRGNYRVSLGNISYIEQIYRNRKRNGILLMVAGGALVAITSINNALHNNQVIDPVYLSIGVGLAATGGLWYSAGKRKYRIGNKWKLKVLDNFQ